MDSQAMNVTSSFISFNISKPLLVQYQYVADLFIAIAYFSIPLELVYFVSRSAVFPYRWIIVQFGAFIILCGSTHLLNLWALNPHSHGVALTMTIAKIMTAIVSCATALTVVHFIPDLMSVKTREMFLKSKAAELDREMGLIRTQEENGRHVRMLTHEIRSSLDRHTILNTTLVELGRTLGLEECTLWIPSPCGTFMNLVRMLRKQSPDETPIAQVPKSHSSVQEILSSNRAQRIPFTSSLVRALESTMGMNARGYSVIGDAVGIRVPLIDDGSFFKEYQSPPQPSNNLGAKLKPSALASSFSLIGKQPPRAYGSASKGLDLNRLGERETPQSSTTVYALLVLVLPSDSARMWHVHELEMVEVVADQVAVALSHAAILEVSLRSRDLLSQQNAEMERARDEADKAIRARNDFLSVLNHQMRTPLHSICALSSLLQETSLTAHQRCLVESISKSGSVLETLVSDVLDLSRLEDGSLELDCHCFNLHKHFQQLLQLVRPIAALRKLELVLDKDPDVPEMAYGDEKRLLQMFLNIVGNALKFTSRGSVRIFVGLDRPEYNWDPAAEVPRPQQGEDFFCLRFQVVDTGVGIASERVPHLFSSVLTDPHSHVRRREALKKGPGLGLPLCKHFATFMKGHIWVESPGPEQGTKVTAVVRLGKVVNVAKSRATCPVNSPSFARSPSWTHRPQLDQTRENRPSFMGPPSADASESGRGGGEEGGATPTDGDAVDRELENVKALVADHNIVNCMVTRGLLHRLGCTAIGVTSGQECLQMLNDDPSFNVVFLELDLPDTPGVEVALRIQSKFCLGERPTVIALTSAKGTGPSSRYSMLGIDAVLIKPVSLDQMRAAVLSSFGTGLAPPLASNHKLTHHHHFCPRNPSTSSIPTTGS